MSPCDTGGNQFRLIRKDGMISGYGGDWCQLAAAAYLLGAGATWAAPVAPTAALRLAAIHCSVSEIGRAPTWTYTPANGGLKCLSSSGVNGLVGSNPATLTGISPTPNPAFVSDLANPSAASCHTNQGCFGSCSEYGLPLEYSTVTPSRIRRGDMFEILSVISCGRHPLAFNAMAISFDKFSASESPGSASISTSVFAYLSNPANNLSAGAGPLNRIIPT